MTIVKPDPNAWWNANVPESEQTVEIPPYLIGTTPRDIKLLRIPQSTYTPLTWDDCRAIVARNDLSAFARSPTDIRLYKKAMAKIKKEYGSVLNFLVNERIGWPGEIRAEGARIFEKEGDYRIMFNDWPYGIDKRIVHLVVWTKFPLTEDPEIGDLTEEARKDIDEFVERTFRQRVPAEHVIWFKNWSAIKSVQALEHLHVMMYNPDPEFIKEVTNRDHPMCEKFIAK